MVIFGIFTVTEGVFSGGRSHTIQFIECLLDFFPGDVSLVIFTY
jgi:hypothetical protein